MKKIYLFFLFLCCFFLCSPVLARDGSTLELISIEEEGVSIDTGDFYYQNVSYRAKRFNEKRDKIFFELVKNQTDEDRPFSVSLLLFDEEQKNIGFISYCSSRELGGDYALLEIKSGASSKFEISLKKDYFITGKGVSYLKYFSILDSNIDCKKYASNKYEGLTIDEIKSGKISSNYKERFPKLMEFFQKYNLKTLLLIVIGSIAFYLVICAIQNLLYKKMFIDGSVLNFIPGIHLCFMVILSFGPIIGVIYFLLFILSIVLWILIHSSALFYILIGIAISCFAFDIIKLISKKYDLCYFDPFTHPDDSPIYNWKKKPVKKVVVENNPMQDEILDLSYPGNTNISNQNDEHVNVGFSLEDLNHDGVVDEKDQEIARNPIDYNQDEIDTGMGFMNDSQQDEDDSNDEKDDKEEFMRMFR